MLEQDEKIRTVFEAERTRLLNFIRRRIPESEEAEDILQDVFYEFTEAYRLMRPVEKITSWLFTVARNRITDMFRKKKTRNFSSFAPLSDSDGEESLGIPLLFAAADGNSDDLLIRNYIVDEIESALTELPDEQRRVFEMHEIEGYSFNELADMTGEKVATLISRKRYAVVYLRSRLQNLYNELNNE